MCSIERSIIKNTIAEHILQALADDIAHNTLPASVSISTIRAKIYNVADIIETDCYQHAVVTCDAMCIDHTFAKHNSTFVRMYSYAVARLISALDKYNYWLLHKLFGITTDDTKLIADHPDDKTVSSSEDKQQTQIKIDPSHITLLNDDDLSPGVNIDIRRIIVSMLEASIPVSITHEFTCSNCGGNDISRSEHQTRASDEASTITYMCIACKHRWVA